MQWWLGGIARMEKLMRPILYQHGWKLVGDRTTKSRLLKVLVTESQFADDLAIRTLLPMQLLFWQTGDSLDWQVVLA